MPDRASIRQVTQIGVETTPGTAVPANKVLKTTPITLAPEGDAEMYRPDNRMLPVAAIPGREWMGLTVGGKVTYTELTYLLASLCGTVAPVADGTNGQKWVFPILGANPKTFTVEIGSAERAHRAAYGIIQELAFELTRAAANLTGRGIAQRLEDGVVMTAGATEVRSDPVVPRDLDFFLDDTASAIGTTKLLRGIRATPRLGGRYGGTWFVNSAVPSFTGHIETAPETDCGLTLAADAAGMQPLGTFRSGATKFLRVQALGAAIAGASASQYRLQIDLALKIREHQDFSDEDGVYATGYACSFADEPVRTGGPKGGEITVVNELSAL